MELQSELEGPFPHYANGFPTSGCLNRLHVDSHRRSDGTKRPEGYALHATPRRAFDAKRVGQMRAACIKS